MIKLKENKLLWLMTTGIIALLGGYLFHTLQIFLPWLLGPMFIIIAVKPLIKRLYWPSQLRDLGLIVLGLQLGSSFTKESLSSMIQYLPIMIVTTALVIGFTILSASIIFKFANITLSTAMIGSFPGGLSQMVILSEEMKDADETVVTFMQMFRIMLVITIVPWVVFHLLTEKTSGEAISMSLISGDGYSLSLWFLLFSLTVVFLLLAKKFHIPIPYLLAPLFAVICFNVMDAPNLIMDDKVIAAAQLCLGAHLGLKMYFNKKIFTPSLLLMTVLSNVMLIGFCLLLAEILHLLFGFPFIEMFISAAPGGVAEMAITAMAVHADVSVVTSFHLFRILVILFIVSPMISKIIRKKQSLQMSA